MIEETVVSIGNPFDDPPAPTKSAGATGNSAHPPQMMVQFGSNNQHYTSFPPSSSSYHAMMYQQQLSNNAPLIHLCAECNREIKVRIISKICIIRLLDRMTRRAFSVKQPVRDVTVFIIRNAVDSRLKHTTC